RRPLVEIPMRLRTGRGDLRHAVCEQSGQRGTRAAVDVGRWVDPKVRIDRAVGLAICYTAPQSDAVPRNVICGLAEHAIGVLTTRGLVRAKIAAVEVPAPVNNRAGGLLTAVIHIVVP